jgi:hypothetical protein
MTQKYKNKTHGEMVEIIKGKNVKIYYLRNKNRDLLAQLRLLKKRLELSFKSIKI